MAMFFGSFNMPGGGVLLIMVFKMLSNGMIDNPASLMSGPSKCSY